MSGSFEQRAREAAARNAAPSDPDHSRRLNAQAALWDDWRARCPACDLVRTGPLEELRRPCSCLRREDGGT